jgi:outer membrane protein assembly factor BamD (BamD/ComL family)
MNINKRHPLISLSLLLILTLFYGLLSVSCSQESNSFVGRTYHNLAARDNAFFLARERMKLVEVKVYDLREDNYNVILHPIPPVDTNKTKALATQLDDIIKKSSIPVRRHKNSDYVDDSYILIGRCRVYKGELKKGMDTYKYMNANGKDENDKIEGLIYLMRAYMVANQYDNVKTVSDYILKQKLTKKNIGLYNVTQAEYLRYFERYDEMIPLLEVAAPLPRKRDIRSRMYFILGQLYQLNGNDTMAYKHYHKVVKSNPPYEMLFESKLYLYQVTDINKPDAKKKLNKYYAKLLKDLKNEDFKDKIYYEMGLFEYKQKNNPKAIENLKKSSQASKSGSSQKGFTFLKLAEIYYEDLEDYENAATYYDSTAQTFNKKDKRYPLIVKRDKVLDEFVKHLNTIKREDSLLSVAKLDTIALNKLIDTLVAREQAIYKAQQLALKKQKELAASGVAPSVTAITNNDPNAKSWYFTNAVAVQTGQQDFKQKWGDRKLEDNWRRSKKEAIIDFTADAKADSLKFQKDSTSSMGEEKNDVKILKIDRKKYLVDIPYTEEAKIKANKNIENALFQVASIYNHKLDETDRAVRTYLNLLKRYPHTEYEPEVLYNLYLIYLNKKDTDKTAFYKNELFTKHPNSIYSKLIRNPNYYRDTKIANKFAEEEYKNIYALYKNNNYSEADSIASSTISKYPDSDILDKLAYVKILCKIKQTDSISTEAIQSNIKTFTELYPESKLTPLVKKLSEAIDKLASDISKETNASGLNETEKSQPIPDTNVNDNSIPPVDKGTSDISKDADATKLNTSDKSQPASDSTTQKNLNPLIDNSKVIK